jgi:hypothetical protein
VVILHCFIVFTKLQARGKIKLLLYLIKHNTMKICGGMEYSIISHSFSLTTSCFTPRKRPPFPPHPKYRRVGEPQYQSGNIKKRKIPHAKNETKILQSQGPWPLYRHSSIAASVTMCKTSDGVVIMNVYLAMMQTETIKEYFKIYPRIYLKYLNKRYGNNEIINSIFS